MITFTSWHWFTQASNDSMAISVSPTAALPRAGTQPATLCCPLQHCASGLHQSCLPHCMESCWASSKVQTSVRPVTSAAGEPVSPRSIASPHPAASVDCKTSIFRSPIPESPVRIVQVCQGKRRIWWDCQLSSSDLLVSRICCTALPRPLADVRAQFATFYK